MKMLSSRTRVLLAIIAGVIVIAALVIIIFQPPEGALFGTTTVQINPYYPTIVEKQTVTLRMTNGVNCKWTKTNNNIQFVNNVNTGSSVTVQGVLAGTTNVLATCTGQIGAGIVKVNRAPTATPKPPLTIDPLNPRIHPDKYEFQYTLLLKAVNATDACTWSVSDSRTGWALVNGGYQIYVLYERIPITLTVTAQCGNESATSTVTYTWMTN